MARCLALWVLLWLMCVVGLSACSSGYSGPFIGIPKAALDPPLYPRAQQVKTTPITFYTYDANWQNRQDTTVYGVTFVTSDKVDTVFAYYVELLSKEGWDPLTPHIQPEVSSVHFYWKDSGCPEYSYDVAVSRNPDNALTQVKLTPWQFTCID